MRKRVEGKSSKNVDVIAKIAREFGMKKSTVMSYWKDASQGGSDVHEIAKKVRQMISDDMDS